MARLGLSQRPDFDSVRQFVKIKQLMEMDPTSSEELVEWILGAEFDERNFYLGEALSELLGGLPETLDFLGEKSSGLGIWSKVVCLACVRRDHSCASLVPLASECSTSDVLEVREAGEQVLAFVASTRGRLKTLLDNCRREVRASSYTFYVPDPPPAGSYQLYLSSGLQFPEAVHGVFLDSQSVKRVFDGESPKIEEPLDKIKESLAIKNQLFMRFRFRERIERTERRIVASPASSKCAVFFNFSSSAIKEGAESAIDHLEPNVRKLLPLILDDSKLPEDDFRKLNAMQSRTYKSANQGALSSFLTEALKGCLDELNLSGADTFGMISLYDACDASITPVATEGDFDGQVKSHSLSIAESQDLLSWVAVKKRALLISDLDSSGFRQLHKEVVPGAQSVLAVPMVAGGQLKGVVYFESRIANAFSQNDLRIVWAFGGFLAAQVDSRRIVYQQYKSIRIGLEKYRQESQDQTLSQKLGGIAALAKEHLRSDHADVWVCDSDGVFKASGSTVPNWTFNSQPREQGWSRYIVQTNRVICLTLQGDLCYGFSVSEGERWERVDDGPEDANPNIHPIIKSELGIPVPVDGHVQAVIWLKFEQQIQFPMHEDVDLAEYFAGILASLRIAA